MKKTLIFFWESIKVILIALAIVIPIRYFLFQPFIVRGESMEPNYSGGDYLIVDRISYNFKSPQRGEVIVFRYPQNPTVKHIKRILGLPGEKVEITEEGIFIYMDDENYFLVDESSYLDEDFSFEKNEINLNENEYFVMGDNRDVSFDSRKWGSLPEKNIIGKVFIKIFPIKDIGIINIPNY
jgi:signal peptidase I